MTASAGPGGSEPSAPRPRGAWVTFAALLVLGGLKLADQGLMLPLYPPIIKEFNLSETAMGLVGGAFVAVTGFVMVIWGSLADTRSRKHLLLLGAFLWSITAYAMTWVHSYEQLFLVRALGGIGVGAFFPVALSMTSDLFGPGRRGRAIGWLYLLPGLGAFAGISVSVIYGPVLGWRFPFQAIGIAGIIAVALFGLLIREPARAQAEPELREQVRHGKAYAYRAKLSDWKVLYQNRANLYVALQGIPGLVPVGVLTTWTIVFLHKDREFPVLLASAFVVSLAAGAVLGNFIGGYLGDLLHRRRGIRWRAPLCAASLAGGALFLALPLWGGFPNLGPGFTESPSEIPRFVSRVLADPALEAAFGFFFLGSLLANLNAPNWFALIQDINLPEIRGSVSGVNNVFYHVGLGIGPVLGGVLGDSLGLRNALLIPLLFWGVSALLWIPLWWHLAPAEKRARETLAARAKEMGAE